MLLVSGTKRKPGFLRKPINSTQDHGYSLCVLRKNNEARTQPHARKRKRGESADDRRARTYHRISEVSADELLSKGTCVLVDPNRRDMLYAMHEHSTAKNPRIYRYTSMSRRRNSGKKAVRRQRAHEVANELLVGAALVTLSQMTLVFSATCRALLNFLTNTNN